MRLRSLSLAGTTAALLALSGGAPAKEVVPMQGGVIIDGYEFGEDIGPKGSIAFDEQTGEFVGHYNGLEMPDGRHAIFAWVHDTVNQKTEYLGPVGLLALDLDAEVIDRASRSAPPASGRAPSGSPSRTGSRTATSAATRSSASAPRRPR